jgi:hypothetical protein
MNGSARVLIIANAFAAAASFVGAWFVAGRVPGLLAPGVSSFSVLSASPIFTRKAENHRRSVRKPGGANNS